MNGWTNTLWQLLSTAESAAFVLAVTLAVLALAWGKAGLKRLNRRQEARCWTWAARAAWLKLGLLPVTLAWTLIATFKH